MMRKFVFFFLCLVLLLLLSGCYSQSKVDQMLDDQADQYLEDYSKLEEDYAELAREKEYYQEYYDRIFNNPYDNDSFDSFEDASVYLSEYLEHGKGNKAKAIEAAEYLTGYCYHITEW